MRVGAIGDVHGDVGRLVTVLDMLEKDQDRIIVLLGDYVNLGPNPAGVLDVLCARRRRLGARLVLLEGNHDRVFREFLRGSNIAQLLAMGGATTVRSYIGQPQGDVSRALRTAVPKEHVELLESLELEWVGENVIAMHQWPVERIDTGDRYVALGHYRQPDHKPHVDGRAVYLDTGCGSDPDGLLSYFLFPELTWHAV